MRECLEAEGLRVSDALEFSAGGWLDILSVSLGAGLGAGGAVSVAIYKFLERHKGKKVTFGAMGQVQTMEGYSAKDVKQILNIVAQRQRELDQAWADMSRQFAHEPHADGEQTPPDRPQG